MAHAARQGDLSSLDPSMKGGLIASGLFHAFIIFLTVVGLPMVIKPPPIVSNPISVEIVAVDKLTQTNKLAPKPIEEKKEEKPPPKPEKPQPPKMTEMPTPPTPAPITPPVEKVKPPEEKALKPAPKKPPPKKEITKKVEEKKSFDSLLKNLADAKPTVDATETKKDSLTAPDALTAPLADRMTMSEMDALRRQLASCWNVLSGAKFAENQVVEIRISVNTDRTLRQATIVNQLQYNTDSVFRAAADAAMRALRNPGCSPLELPAGKYNEWKDTIITFDPREML